MGVEMIGITSRPIGNEKLVYLLIFVVTGAILIADWLLPLGVAVWLLYLAPLLIVALKMKRQLLYPFATLFSALVLIGVFEHHILPTHIAIANRILDVCMLWLSAFLISRQKRGQEVIEELNNSLTRRSQELETANRELEAYSYTVAHDLRKPLTVINGYSQVLNELCSSNLDQECRDYLLKIFDGTSRMSRLIDVLLNFSCLTHAQLQCGRVDLSAIAQTVASELKLSAPERNVRLNIGTGIEAVGDGNLLRVVLDNLLGNAWKYTEIREEAVIGFGVTEMNGERVYFVDDNGVGFDMGVAEKMFTPFERLPGSEKFRGFGIGLATVERIIRRHGGRIWAKGEPGKGAIFYFTLKSSDVTECIGMF